MFRATAKCTYQNDGEECGHEVSVEAPSEFTARDGAEHILYHYHQDNVMHRRNECTEIVCEKVDD